ncbi:hypothetical protein GCM10010327_29570 [Streptomyces nitrosporeus]|nr:hypothetical protein GCM10010327_29570 [Streptomyces nitrosporeus]
MKGVCRCAGARVCGREVRRRRFRRMGAGREEELFGAAHGRLPARRAGGVKAAGDVVRQGRA